MAHLDASGAPHHEHDARGAPQDTPKEAGECALPVAQLARPITVSRSTYHQCGAGRRVKLYALEEDAWADRGTGYCAGVYDEETDDALIFVRREELCEPLGAVADAGENAPPYMVVVSDTLDADEYLLHAQVSKDDVYQRQQETLIVWTDPSGTDLALSFQELEGCSEVWDFLSEVQRHFSAAGHSSDSAAEPFALPDPDFANLEDIHAQLAAAVAQGTPTRDRVVEWLLHSEFLHKLCARFDEAESLEALDVLHQLYVIMETIVGINDYLVIEQLLNGSVYMSVVGILEYSPKYPTHKASYREFLRDETRFHQVVDIQSEAIIHKIHDTYRLLYLKDVVLANILDDAALSMLNSLAFFYKSDIVSYFASDEHALAQVADIFASDDEHRRLECVLFLQQLCAMGKQVQLQARLALFHSLVESGLMAAVEFAIRRTGAIRAAAIEILMESIEYDAPSVQQHVLAQIEQGRMPLVSVLIDMLLDSPDPATKAQMAEVVRVLLDTGEAAPRPDQFLTWLYESDMERLFAPLHELPELQPGEPLRRIAPDKALLWTLLCDLLGLVVARHSFRSQYFVLTTGVLRRAAALLHARDKHIQLAALRLFRSCVECTNQFMHRHLVDIGVVGQLLSMLEREAPRDNLVSSACLGLFDYVRRANVRTLIQLLADVHGEQMRRLSADPVAGACISALLQHVEKGEHRAPAPQRPQPSALDDDARESDDEERYFASEESRPSLVPYDEEEDEEEEEAEEEEASAATIDSLARGMRRRRESSGAGGAGGDNADTAAADNAAADDDDDEFAARVSKRKHAEPLRQSPRAKRLALRIGTQ